MRNKYYGTPDLQVNHIQAATAETAAAMAAAARTTDRVS